MSSVSFYHDSQLSVLAKANIEALASSEDETVNSGEGGGWDTVYERTEGTCTITVGAKGKIKVFGVGIMYANAQGEISFDGKVVCHGGGNSSCTPIECIQLYEAIF